MKRKFDLLKTILLCFIFCAGFTACESDDPIDNQGTTPSASGVFILNQGRYGSNNAGISYYDFETEKTNFDIVNGRLGDNAQDMLVYGSKLYVVVSGSGYILVLDLNTQSTLKKIELRDEGGQNRQPRYLTSYEGVIYATTYDGNVVRLDTTSLAITGITPVGPNPEGIAAVDGKLYVANSDGGNYPNVGNTLSIVNIIAGSEFKEIEKIIVGLNPFIVKADKYGDVYLTYQGNFNDTPGGIQRIDTKTKKVSNLGDFANHNFTIDGDLLYFYKTDYGKNSSFGVFDVKTETLTSKPVISDETKITTAYGIGVDPVTKEVYISDTDYSNPGTVTIFDADGKKKKVLEVGINACQFAFH
jgi:DNA-binding beta-propeller fold protein YncE